MKDGNRLAPEGCVYVCAACGKRSEDLYGEFKADVFWDESCMINAVLARKSHLVIDMSSGRVSEIMEGGIVDEQ